VGSVATSTAGGTEGAASHDVSRGTILRRSDGGEAPPCHGPMGPFAEYQNLPPLRYQVSVRVSRTTPHGVLTTRSNGLFSIGRSLRLSVVEQEDRARFGEQQFGRIVPDAGEALLFPLGGRHARGEPLERDVEAVLGEVGLDDLA
jgi:hypothetical protein